MCTCGIVIMWLGKSPVMRMQSFYRVTKIKMMSTVTCILILTVLQKIMTVAGVYNVKIHWYCSCFVTDNVTVV